MMDLKNKKIKILGDRIFLKRLTLKNATREYCGWLNDKEVNKYLETRKATVAELKKYIKEKNRNPNCLFLGIFFEGGAVRGKHIGNIKLEPIDWKNKKATIGILIGNKGYWGRGMGTEATNLLVDYAFQKLNLKKIGLGVISENVAAINVYKKAGFSVDRVEKKSIRHGNKLFNRLVMSIKKMDYK